MMVAIVKVHDNACLMGILEMVLFYHTKAS